MRLALLCDDSAVVPWLDAMVSDSTHEVVVAASVSPRGAELLRGRAGIRLTDRWEDLLLAREIDAILVGGCDPALLEAIKQLATAGQPILFLPQAAQGSTFLYELSLIRDDNRVKLFPALWHRGDAALLRLHALLRDGSLGAVRLIQLDRELPRATDSESLPQSTVDAALLPDLDLLRWLGGDYNQATAIRTGTAEAAVLMQTVTLAGRALPEATWHVQSTGGAAVSRLTVHAERGRAVAELDASTGEWTLTEPSGARVIGNRVTAARGRLDEVAALLSREDSPAAWSDLVKVFETLDATQRSVTRRRTIDLHFEPMSERATFKTQMIAMGCGVLTATLMLMLAYLAVASFVPSEETERLQWMQSASGTVSEGGQWVGSGASSAGPPASNWRHARTALVYARLLVFTPLAIFLVLQLLYPLSRPTTTAAANESESDRVS